MKGRDIANSRDSGNEERRASSKTQNSRQQKSRPQERNSTSNIGNNRRVRSKSRASKGNDRSTGRSNYNRRPFWDRAVTLPVIRIKHDLFCCLGK